MLADPSNPLPAARHIEQHGHQAVQLILPNGSQAVVLRHGAQVVSWLAAGEGEQLYLSTLSRIEEGTAVRGGVPVIFPQFEQKGPDFDLPRHGFARTTAWQVDSMHAQGGDQALCTLKLTDSEATLAIWPHRFALELTVALSPNRLDMELHISNTDDHAWSFSAALHTYLGISDLTQVRLQGLNGCRFTDAKINGEHTEDQAEKRFAGHIDRIYTKVPPSLLLRDGSRKLTLSSEAFEDLVVWNPGPELCAGILDMPDDDWMQMLCVESAQIMQAPTLQAGESWTGRQSLILSTKTTERQAQVHASRHQQRLDVGQQFVGARAVTHK